MTVTMFPMGVRRYWVAALHTWLSSEPPSIGMFEGVVEPLPVNRVRHHSLIAASSFDLSASHLLRIQTRL